MRRAQVSLFVIVGFVMIVILALLLTFVGDIRQMLVGSQRERYVSYDYEQGSFESHLDSCLDAAVDDTVMLVASRAGYLSAYADARYGEVGSSSYVVLAGNEVPVVLDSSGEYFLDDEGVSRRICRLAYISMDSCFDVSSYEAKGFNVTKEPLANDLAFIDSNCKAVLKDGSVLVIVNYSASLSHEHFRFNTTGFSAEAQLPLKLLMDDARRLVSTLSGNVSAGLNLSQGCGLSPGVSEDEPTAGVIRLEEDVSASNVGFGFQFAVRDYAISGSCP